jgi:hypothetical protein
MNRLQRFLGRFMNRYHLDDRIYVEYVSRTQLRYHEANRSVLISSEVVTGHSIAVDRSTIQAWEAPRGGPVDHPERDRIFENTRRALELNGYKVEEIQD